MKPGDTLQDRYRIDGLLAEGSLGDVYLATHLDLGTELVVKMLKSADERLLHEGRVLSKLRSPHTVRVLDFSRTEDGRPFLLLERVEGRPLGAVINEGPLERDRAIHIISQVLESLEEAHTVGLVHGELAPAHVMVGVHDHATVIEFGGASADHSKQQDLTAAGLLLRAMLTGDFRADHSELTDEVRGWLDRAIGPDATPFSDAAHARAALQEVVVATRRPPDDLIGTVVGGRYEVLELMERRPEGLVYRVALVGGTTHGGLLRTRPDLPRDSETQARFREIIRELVKVRHPNIGRTLDYGYLDDGTPYYVEALPTGGTLFRHLGVGRLSEERTIAVMRDCAEALHYAARFGWRHGALNLGNVELPERPAAVTARVKGFAASALSKLAGQDIPDRRVAAPEVLRGESLSEAADIYALGIVASACSGASHPAWTVADPTDLHLKETRWELGDTVDCSDDVKAVIERCMAKDLGERFVDTADLLQALERLGNDEVGAPAVLPQPGALLDGRYELESVLGTGGFARVFRATDRKGAATVAVKILHAHLASEDDRRRFEREGELVFTHLEDRHTLRVLDYGVSRGGHYFIVTEYIDGQTLDGVLADWGPLPPRRVAAIVTQVLSSLHEAHARQVFHRDIKPQNVMMSQKPYSTFRGDTLKNCWVTVLDFGVASMQGELHDATSLTLTGTACGTARYMAPEQMFGQVVNAATDIYSLGLIAYELLTGEKAIKGRSNGEIVTNQVSAQSAILPADLDISIDLRMIVNKMIRKDRETRFQSTGEVLKALGNASI